MEIGKVFKEATEVLKKSPVIFVPIITLSVLMFLLSILVLGGESFPLEDLTTFETIPHGMWTMVWVMTILGILDLVLWLFVHGMTVGMAQQVVETGATTLDDGIDIAKGRFLHLLGGAVLMGIVMFVGFMFFFLPGLVATFFLMFSFVAIVMEDLSPVEGLKRSIAVVKAHAGDTFLLFSIFVLMALVVGIVSVFLGFIPLLGQAFQILLSGAFSGFISVVTVLAYRELSKSQIGIQE